MSDENFYYLSILVEQDLYRRIKAIREGNFPNQNEMIQETIISFEKGLPEYLKRLEGKHEFIIRKIKKIDYELKKINEEKRSKTTRKKIKDSEEER